MFISFQVSAVEDFLPMQLIYPGSTKRCFPNFYFSNDFNAAFTKIIDLIWRKLLSILKSHFFILSENQNQASLPERAKCL